MNFHRLTFVTLLAATPLLAQHEGHAVTEPDAISATSAAENDPAVPATTSHAGHDVNPDAEAAPADPHAGHVMAAEAAAEDPHAAHTTAAEPAAEDPHAAHTTAAEPAAEDPHAAHTTPAEPDAEDPHAAHATAAEPVAEDPHAAHTTATEPAPEDPHAAHTTAAEPVAEDPHAAHTTATEPAEDPHAGHAVTPDADTAEAAAPAHDMAAMVEAAAVPEAEPPPEAFSGPAHAADTFYGSALMAQAREHVRSEHGDFRSYWFMADQMETSVREGDDAYVWNAQGWYGGDINKLWLKTEGEGDLDNAADQVEVQALWSHAITPWFDFQAGVRHDFRPGPQWSHLVLGIQGVAPYQFEIDAAAFASDAGDLSARFEAEYDQLLTQRLILQPRIELNLAAQDVPELGIGSGLGTAELGLRLRYQLAREIAPYIGVEYEYLGGNTANFAAAAGEDTEGWNFVVGARIWF